MHQTLISAADLQAHLGDPGWRVFDLRHDLTDAEAGRRAYAQGHIAGARFLHLDDDLSGPRRFGISPGGRRSDGGRHPLPDRETLRTRLEQLGVGDHSQVVAVDAHGGMFAARLWWLLRWLGHARVAVLDGGLAAWTEGGHALVGDAPPQPAPSVLSVRPPLVGTASIDTLAENLATQALRVVDARSPDRFRGENETLDPVGGHIPGAMNRFFKDNLDPSGRFKAPAALRADWAPLVGDDASRAVMLCGSGVTACHNLLALEVAGLPGAALYAGSWSDWVSDPSRPVAVGP